MGGAPMEKDLPARSISQSSSQSSNSKVIELQADTNGTCVNPLERENSLDQQQVNELDGDVFEGELDGQVSDLGSSSAGSRPVPLRKRKPEVSLKDRIELFNNL